MTAFRIKLAVGLSGQKTAENYKWAGFLPL